MTGRVKVGVAIACGVAVVALVGLALWMNRPFRAELGSYRTSLADRSEAQRHNIRQAVMVLDGVIIEPGATFSFNDTVGPRTPERGYREAFAFMEKDLVTSIGGGICQVSSTIYNAAALAGLTIVERHSHFRQVSSVPPGRDATVWYGAMDLRIMNSFHYPIRLRLMILNEGLCAVVLGNMRRAQWIRVQTHEIPSNSKGVFSSHTFRETKFPDRPIISETLSVNAYQAF